MEEKMKKLLSIGLAVWLVVGLLSVGYAQPNIPKENIPTDISNDVRQQDDTQKLLIYLQKERVSQKQLAEMQEIINKCQVIFLFYKKDTPIKNESDRRNQQALVEIPQQKGVYVTPISGHRDEKIYLELSATFSVFYMKMEPNHWQELMKLPIDYDYGLDSVHIVYIPSIKIKMTTFQKCQTIMSEITRKLEFLKSRYRQLQEFDKTVLSPGRWNNAEWPRYASIFYRFGFGEKIPMTKGDYKKTTKNWCEIQVYCAYCTGNPRAAMIPCRIYPRQGVTINWFVLAANNQEIFKKEVSQIIVELLTALDEYEKELGPIFLGQNG